MQTQIDIPFPIGGIDTRRAYQTEDIQTTVQAVNILPNGQIENRMRGGVRNGLSRRYETNVDEIPAFLVPIESDTAVSGEHIRYIVVGSQRFIYRSRSQKNTNPGEKTTYDDYLELISGNIGTGSGVALADSVSVAVDSGLQLVFIADSADPVIDGTNGTLTAGVLTISEDTAEVDVSDHVAFLVSSGCPAIKLNAYEITSKTTNTLTLDTSTVQRDSGVGNGTVDEYQVRKGNKYVDLKNGTSGLFTATKGFAPQGANLVAIYRNRVVWVYDNLWYMSRQGDPYDYDYGADVEDQGRAVAGSIAESGQAPNPIIAMAPFGDDFLVLFGEDRTWVMRGDPAAGGQIDSVDRMVGCVDTNAWCYAPQGQVYFLSKEGLYMLGPGASPVAVPVSRGRLPRELRDADRDNFNTTLVYDSEDNGVFIFVTPKLPGVAGEHWYYHVDTKSFWKIRFKDNNHQPVCAVNYSSDPTTNRQTVLAGIDGYLRTFDGTDTDDDSESVQIESELVLGPFRSGDAINVETKITEFISTLAKDSGSVTFEIYGGVDAESAVDAAIAANSPIWTATISAGRSRPSRPRVRAAAFCLRISTTSSIWSYETISLGIAAGGDQRI